MISAPKNGIFRGGSIRRTVSDNAFSRAVAVDKPPLKMHFQERF
jgi:hypothetical protein